MVTHIKFYMENGPRGWQPIAVEVHAATGKPRYYEDDYGQKCFDALRVRENRIRQLVADAQSCSANISQWVRITEKQARAIDKELNYASMERLTGQFFGTMLTDYMGRHFPDGWVECLDARMDSNQFRVYPSEVKQGDTIVVQAYADSSIRATYKMCRGRVIDIKRFSQESKSFVLQGPYNGNTPELYHSRMYGPRSLVTRIQS